MSWKPRSVSDPLVLNSSHRWFEVLFRVRPMRSLFVKVPRERDEASFPSYT